MKSKEALDFFLEIANSNEKLLINQEWLERYNRYLQQIVDKETPIKAMFIEEESYSYIKYKVYRGICRKCGEKIYSNNAYCKTCGQKLDWLSEVKE